MDEFLDVKQKSLRLNLDPRIYGTFAEIGAGQEVVRHFFRVGRASQTIAKAISAYDMTFSDAIYGKSPQGRYVSRARVLQMLDYEYDLLTERLVSEDYKEINFFSFANTVTTTNYSGGHPHAWMGIKFQLEPQAEPNYFVCHVALINDSADFQKIIVGILGVNLIYAAYFLNHDHELMIKSLADDLSKESVHFDAIQVYGPEFSCLDSKKLNLFAMALGYSRAAVFGTNNEIMQPKDFFYKKDVALLMIDQYQPLPAQKFITALLHKICQHEGCTSNEVSLVVNIVLREKTVIVTPSYDIDDFYTRCQQALGRNYTVLASNFGLDKDLVDYFARSSVASLMVFIEHELFVQRLNKLVKGHVRNYISYMSDLFCQKTRIYLYNSDTQKEPSTLNPLCQPFFSYLCELGFIIKV